ncbi:MAG: UbiA prenyltransferase family protein [Candidatus Thermoplasmatota archaeon]
MKIGMIKGLLKLMGIPFWIVAIGPLYLGWVIGSKTIVLDWKISIGLLIIGPLVGGSTLAYNEYCDRDIDLHNIRKRSSILLRGIVEPSSILRLYIFLIILAVLLSLTINITFTLLISLCILLSIFYSHPFFRVKEIGGLDIIVNIFGIGVVIPLAGFSIASELKNFPYLNLVPIASAIGGLYALTTVADYLPDRKSGANSLAVKIGIRNTIYLGLCFHLLSVTTNISLLMKYSPTPIVLIIICLISIGIVFFYWFYMIKQSKIRYRRLLFTLVLITYLYGLMVGVWCLSYIGFV